MWDRNVNEAFLICDVGIPFSDMQTYRGLSAASALLEAIAAGQGGRRSRLVRRGLREASDLQGGIPRSLNIPVSAKITTIAMKRPL